MSGLLLASGARVDVSRHAERATTVLLVLLALAIVFFLLRPELWRRMFFERVDPRPAALMRLGFGTLLISYWCGMLPLARILFTDEGLWLTELARRNYARRLSFLWDPVEGFEHGWHLLKAMWGPFTVLHFRSDPPLVFAIWAALLLALLCLTLGVWTRTSTLVAWLLVEQLYGYSTIFYTSADFAIRAFLFLAIFLRWGEAYSVDSWRRRRRAIRRGAHVLPPLRAIPVWPQRLMMLQLAIIYCATGLLKSGYTWKNGTALYYALNLDHFYRVPMTGLVSFLQGIGVLPLATWTVHWWEILFPLALVGLAVRGWERDRAEGRWVAAPRWRRVGSWAVLSAFTFGAAWVLAVAAYYYYQRGAARLPFDLERDQLIPLVFALAVLTPAVAVSVYVFVRRRWPRLWARLSPWLLGRRVWLGFGVAMHVGIASTMEVGSFSQVMLVAYLPWLTGPDVDRAWRFAFSRPCRLDEGGRPLRVTAWKRRLLAPWDRLVHRLPGPTYTVRYEATQAGVRRAALLRIWDLGSRLRFEPAGRPPGALEVEVPGGATLRDAKAGSALTRIFPGLWWLVPLGLVPGLSARTGALALRLLGQRERWPSPGSSPPGDHVELS